jgi:hypothetical protein
MKENFAYQQLNEFQKEFEAKNELLREYFQEINPIDYLHSIFPDKSSNDDFFVVIGTLKDPKGKIIEKGTITRVKFEEVLGLSWRPNAYIPYADFKNNYYHSKTLEKVRAFVVDIDNLTSLTLKRFIKFHLNEFSLPTYIINSGKGIHLIYQLSEPIPVKGLRLTLNKLNQQIQDTISEVLKVDKHPLMQPYRFPGFTTKINTISTVFKLRDSYNLQELLEKFKVKINKEMLLNRYKKEGRISKIIPLPNGSIYFFKWFCRKLFKNPPIPGRRHNTFFALGIVSYKCKRVIPKEEAKEVIYMLYEIMEEKNLHFGFSLAEALKAFEKGYNTKAITVSWKYLCQLLEWEYKPNKRNGRKREEHLELARGIKELKLRKQREEKLKKVLELKQKGLSLRQISKLLNIPYRTLISWLG